MMRLLAVVLIVFILGTAFLMSLPSTVLADSHDTGNPPGDKDTGNPPGPRYSDSGKETTGKIIGIPNPLCPPGTPNCERSSIIGVMNIILGALLWIATPLAVFFIIIAAFRIMNSGGDPGKVKEAQMQIMWVCIGYAVILISKSIVSEVVRIIGSPTL